MGITLGVFWFTTGTGMRTGTTRGQGTALKGIGADRVTAEVRKSQSCAHADKYRKDSCNSWERPQIGSILGALGGFTRRRRSCGISSSCCKGPVYPRFPQTQFARILSNSDCQTLKWQGSSLSQIPKTSTGKEAVFLRSSESQWQGCCLTPILTHLSDKSKAQKDLAQYECTCCEKYQKHLCHACKLLHRPFLSQ